MLKNKAFFTYENEGAGCGGRRLVPFGRRQRRSDRDCFLLYVITNHVRALGGSPPARLVVEKEGIDRDHFSLVVISSHVSALEASPCFFVSIEETIHFGPRREEPRKTSHCFFVSIDKMVYLGSEREEAEMQWHSFFNSFDKSTIFGLRREEPGGTPPGCGAWNGNSTSKSVH